jgi:hypothetical protein
VSDFGGNPIGSDDRIDGPWMERMRKELNNYEQLALSRLILNDQRDAATTAIESANFEELIENIAKQVKKVAKKIQTADLLFIAFEDECS